MAVYKIDGFGTRNQTDGSGFDANKERRQRFVQMYASEAISKGQLVAIDLNGTEPANGYGNHVMVCDVGDATNKIGIGVATVGAASGELFSVQVAGYCDYALTDITDATPGNLLSAGQAGLLDLYDTSENPGATGGDQIPVAIHIADGTSDAHTDSKVYLLNPLNL